MFHLKRLRIGVLLFFAIALISLGVNALPMTASAAAINFKITDVSRTYVKGTADPNQVVSIVVDSNQTNTAWNPFVGTTLVSQATDAEGNFVLAIPPRFRGVLVTDNTKFIVKQWKKVTPTTNSLISERRVTPVSFELGLSLKPVYNTMDYITGWGEPGADVYVTVAGSKLEGKVDENGKFAVYFDQYPLSYGCQITVREVKGKGSAEKNTAVSYTGIGYGSSESGSGFNYFLNNSLSGGSVNMEGYTTDIYFDGVYHETQTNDYIGYVGYVGFPERHTVTYIVKDKDGDIIFNSN